VCFQNREPRHQPGRQRRPAGAIGVHRAELLFQKPPVDRPRQLRQHVIHVDDLVEPRTKQILLAAFPTLPWPHRPLRSSRRAAENHGLRFKGIANFNLQENRRRCPSFRQIQLQEFPQFLLLINRFRIVHGRLAMEHQFFIRQQNLKLYRSLVAASEAAAAKADARQEKLLKLLAEEVANEPPPRKN
jgi:hypothetical protein